MKIKKILSLLLSIIMLTSVFCLPSVSSTATENWLWPVPSSRTVNGTYSDSHDGLDIGGAEGCSVVASMSGTVVYSHYGDISGAYYGGGNFVVIRHANGYYSHYAHLSSRSVSEGQTVSRGQEIGKMGSTGNSTGTHLHFAIATNQYGAGGRINNNVGVINYDYTTDTTNHNPTGIVDSITTENGIIRVRGWAFDKDEPKTPISIHVYVGGPAGTGSGTDLGVANDLRADVGKVYPSAGDYHGFDRQFLSKRTGKVDVYVYAINIGLGSSKLLTQQTITVTSHSTHKYEFASIKNESTCNSNGVEIHKCICGATEEIELPKKEHTIVTDEAVSPTCSEIGLTQGSHCSVCNEIIVEQKVIPKLNHDYTVSATNVVPNTCKSEGSYQKTLVCSHCNDEIVVNVTVPKSEHIEMKRIEHTVAVGCETAGSYDVVKYCAECGEELSRETFTINPTGHIYIYDSKNANGELDYNCALCGEHHKEKATDVIANWNGTLLNQAVSSTKDNNSSLLDVVPDGIINAKDYAMLLNLAR